MKLRFVPGKFRFKRRIRHLCFLPPSLMDLSPPENPEKNPVPVATDPQQQQQQQQTQEEQQQPQSGLRRSRPAPAKTFQCRGYGECRMVFSRSEHLARHIRYALPSTFYCFLPQLFSSQKTHWRAPLYLPLHQAVFAP